MFEFKNRLAVLWRVDKREAVRTGRGSGWPERERRGEAGGMGRRPHSYDNSH